MKKLVALFLAAEMCLSFAACGESQSSGNGSGNRIEDRTPVINIGEQYETDRCEFSVDYIHITEDVIPPQADSWYSHYEADTGKVYVDLCIAYKNLNTSDVGADEVISGKLIYSGKYEYKGFSMIEEDNRSDFTYSNITNISPLSTEYVHYLFEVPEEVSTSGAEIVLKMNIGGTEYKIIVREGDGSADQNTSVKPGKTSGEVSLKEVVVTKNCEFYVDYSDITNDVVPLQADSWYSHYEADSGKVYVDICFAYKNTTGKNVGADDVISAKLKYAGKYEYKGFSMIEEDSRSDFTYSNITNISPLSTEYVHYLFEVPEEVQSSSKAVVITFTVDGNTYTFQVK